MGRQNATMQCVPSVIYLLCNGILLRINKSNKKEDLQDQHRLI